MELAPSGKRLYMLRWGDYERSSSGPYLGDTCLDFAALAKAYRQESYAQAEAKEEDYCPVDEDGFATWLVDKGLLSPVETENVDINTSSDSAYLPKHWPVCPVCGDGRGEKEYGECRKSLNRINTFRRCT